MSHDKKDWNSKLGGKNHRLKKKSQEVLSIRERGASSPTTDPNRKAEHNFNKITVLRIPTGKNNEGLGGEDQWRAERDTGAVKIGGRGKGERKLTRGGAKGREKTVFMHPLQRRQQGKWTKKVQRKKRKERKRDWIFHSGLRGGILSANIKQANKQPLDTTE